MDGIKKEVRISKTTTFKIKSSYVIDSFNDYLLATSIYPHSLRAEIYKEIEDYNNNVKDRYHSYSLSYKDEEIEINTHYHCWKEMQKIKIPYKIKRLAKDYAYQNFFPQEIIKANKTYFIDEDILIKYSITTNLN